MKKPDETIRPALVAELGFSMLCQIANDAKAVDHALAHGEAVARLVPLVDDPASLEAPPSTVEEAEAIRIFECLRNYFASRKEKALSRPVFHGCGYVDSSEGDLLTGRSLFEVKTVDRPFRSIDVRQLVTYGALNHLSQQYRIDSFGVFNPRRGIFFELPVETVCYEISGQPSQELFEAVIHAISSGDISR